MANITTAPGLVPIDPIEGLVNYVEEFKPFHTKVFDVLSQYIYSDNVNTTFSEFAETIAFNWTGNNVLDIVSIVGSDITVSGDYTNAVKVDDIALVEGNTDTYVTQVVYNSGSNETVITLNTAPTYTTLPLTITIQEVDITYYYEFPVLSVQPTAADPSQSPLTAAKTNTNNIILGIQNTLDVPTITLGPNTVTGANASSAIQVGAEFQIQGSLYNDGVYYAMFVQFEPISNTTTIGVGATTGVNAPSLTAGGGGFVVPYRYIS